MPIAPYVLVLAQTSHEGAKYVRRAELQRGRWRIAARASSIRGIRKAEVHCLPGFHKRPDRHSILGELRYAQCEWFDVEMPLTEAEIADLRQDLLVLDERSLEVAYRANRLRDAFIEATGDTPPVEDQEVLTQVAESRANRRRRKCPDCGVNHYKDEACPRTDGVKETPVADLATMFD